MSVCPCSPHMGVCQEERGPLKVAGFPLLSLEYQSIGAPFTRKTKKLAEVHIIFGLFGAVFVLVSGFDTAGRTALTKGTSMMLVFMGTITWPFGAFHVGLNLVGLIPSAFSNYMGKVPQTTKPKWGVR